MSDNVTKLSEYRKEVPSNHLCWVTFVGHPFRLNDKEVVHQVTVEISDGNYEALISRVRDDGGFYGKSLSGIEAFFSPWPCAAVLVRHQYAHRETPNTHPA